MTREKIVSLIRNVPDFPKKGILFKDITPLLANPEAFKAVIDDFIVLCKNKGITKIVALESRGFIFGAPLAYALGVGFVPIRKRGKLPYKKLSIEFDLEYGKDIIEMHQDALDKNDKVLLVDDLLATGGTMSAAIKLIEQLGAKIEMCAFMCELEALKGKEKLSVPSKSLIVF